MLTATGILVSMTRILFFPSKLRKGIHPLAPLCAPVLGFANAIFKFAGFFMTIYWFIPFVRIEELKVINEDEDGNDEDDVEETERTLSEDDDEGGERAALLTRNSMIDEAKPILADSLANVISEDDPSEVEIYEDSSSVTPANSRKGLGHI